MNLYTKGVGSIEVVPNLKKTKQTQHQILQHTKTKWRTSYVLIFVQC
jgi:hypothetical protein